MPNSKLTHPNKSHPGKAGRKPALLPLHTKKFRATEQAWQEFLSHLAGDSQVDFEILLQAVMYWRKDGGVHVSE